MPTKDHRYHRQAGQVLGLPALLERDSYSITGGKPGSTPARFFTNQKAHKRKRATARATPLGCGRLPATSLGLAEGDGGR